MIKFDIGCFNVKCKFYLTGSLARLYSSMCTAYLPLSPKEEEEDASSPSRFVHSDIKRTARAFSFTLVKKMFYFNIAYEIDVYFGICSYLHDGSPTYLHKCLAIFLSHALREFRRYNRS